MNYHVIATNYKETANLLDFAINELSLIYGPLDKVEDEQNKWMVNHILGMIQEFCKEGHSGFSASYAIEVLNKLLKFQPLTPLTGSDNEWSEVESGMWQNVRCPTIFKNSDGKAYNIDGKVFMDENGCSYTNINSRVYIDFPYTPKTIYVKVKSLKEEAKTNKFDAGIYAAFKVHKETSNAIKRWAKRNGIKNACLKPLHVTTVYSPKFVDYKPLGKLDEPWISNPTSHRLKMFPSPDKIKKSLVIAFHCPLAIDCWNRALNMKANWKHKGFHSHVTISYDCGKINFSELEHPNMPIILTEEYMNPLEVDWAK